MSECDGSTDFVGDAEGSCDGDVVLDEEVGGGVGGAPDELGNLEDCEGSFEGLGDAVVEGREGEVGVLISTVSKSAVLGCLDGGRKER